MKQILTLAALILGSQTYAQIGSPVTTRYECPQIIDENFISLYDYEVECTTQPVAPQYSLMGCDLIKYNLNEEIIVPLDLKKQSISKALLQNKSEGVRIKMNKITNHIYVSFGHKTTLLCMPKPSIGGGMSIGN